MSEEIDLLKIFKNLYKRKKVLLAIMILVNICMVIYLFGFKINKVKVYTTILSDKADTSITEIAESISNNEVSITFESTKKTFTLMSYTSDVDHANQRIEEKKEELKNRLVEVYNSKTFTVLQGITTEKTSTSDIAKTIAIFEFVGLLIYAGYIYFYTLALITVDDYEIFKSTGLKVLGRNHDTDIIKTNIELYKEVKNPKTILFLGAESSINNLELIVRLAKSNNSKKIAIVSDVKVDEKIKNVSFVKLNDDISKEAIEKKIEELKKKYAYVYINGNKINRDYRSIVLSNIVDSNIIVSRMERTPLEKIIRTKQYILDVDGKISGVILV